MSKRDLYGDHLITRWFTARGQRVRREALKALREAAPRDELHEILGDMRRPGLPESILDLRGLDLRGEDLTGCRMTGVDLSWARLDRAILVRADLSRVRLYRASLIGADLCGANLRYARLHHCNLSVADLRQADLENANLKGSQLSATLLRDAIVDGVDFKQVRLEGIDLSQVRCKRQTRRVPVLAPRPTRRLRALKGGGRAVDDSAPRPTVKLTKSLPQSGRVDPQLAGSPQHFEEALARILLQRGRVTEITITLDGTQQVLLFRREQAASKVA